MLTRFAIFIAAVVSASLASAQETPSFKGGFPTADEARLARDDADFQRAVVAYRFWYPTVSVEGIFHGNRELGLNDNEAMPIVAAGPRHVGFTLNSDTPYCGGVVDVKDGPYVIELPPGPFIGLANDHHQGWILDMGIPGPDGGKGGRHLVLPPGYTGEIPKGYNIGFSTSNKVLIALRALPVKGDVKGAIEALKSVKIHPLAASGKVVTMRDVTDKQMNCTCLQWEDNLSYWEKLHAVIEAEPLKDKFLPMYGELAALGIERGKPFRPDARMQAILSKAARAGRDQLLVSGFASSRPDRIAWTDRKWEWVGLVPSDAQFETSAGIDLEARDRWFAQAIVTSPAMFRRKEGQGSLYWLGHRDATGAYLDGGKSYKLTIPLPVPAGLFWSVTIYDAATRSEVQANQDKAALRSMFELKELGDAKSVDLYFGPEAPKGQEGRWLQTVAGKAWFAYFRIYGPEKAAFDRSWRPCDFALVQ